MRCRGQKNMQRTTIRAAWVAVALVIGSGFPAIAAEPYRAPRNADGAPDLGGVWTNNFLTRLQRPAGLAPLVVSPVDASAVERRLMKGYKPDASTENVG